MLDERFLSPEASKALHAEWSADQAAARARDCGEADAATYDRRVREGADTIRHLGPEQPAAVGPTLGRVLAEMERSWARRDAPGRTPRCGRDNEPER